MIHQYKINKGYIFQYTANKICIFDNNTSVLYTLNETASFIFDKVKIGWNKDKIISRLTKECTIPLKRAEKDYDLFLNILEDKGIISKT